MNLHHDTHDRLRLAQEQPDEVCLIGGWLEIGEICRFDAALAMFGHFDLQALQKLRRESRAVAKQKQQQLVQVGRHPCTIVCRGRAVTPRASADRSSPVVKAGGVCCIEVPWLAFPVSLRVRQFAAMLDVTKPTVPGCLR